MIGIIGCLWICRLLGDSMWVFCKIEKFWMIKKVSWVFVEAVVCFWTSKPICLPLDLVYIKVAWDTYYENDLMSQEHDMIWNIHWMKTQNGPQPLWKHFMDHEKRMGHIYRKDERSDHKRVERSDHRLTTWQRWATWQKASGHEYIVWVFSWYSSL